MKHLSIFLLIFFMTACIGNKGGLDNQDDLYGKWDITNAKRNDRITTTLKDGYIHFIDNTTLETNLMGDTIQASYEINSQRILSKGNFPYQFNIDKLTADSMILSGRMKVFDMVFYLEKNPIEADINETPMIEEDEKVLN